MKKIIYICDRCKNEVAESITEVCGYELCDKCAAKAAELVAKFVTMGVPEREERTKKWDVGKAQALRDAGWTIEKIAEENTEYIDHGNTLRTNGMKPDKLEEDANETNT